MGRSGNKVLQAILEGHWDSCLYLGIDLDNWWLYRGRWSTYPLNTDTAPSALKRPRTSQSRAEQEHMDIAQAYSVQTELKSLITLNKFILLTAAYTSFNSIYSKTF
ncbi:hypothetical protein PAEPH01_0523 [Pancytospora epiphaga]|nr:hypothetical protein PAEPH01_0523 [Pancytospora epiphaga]